MTTEKHRERARRLLRAAVGPSFSAIDFQAAILLIAARFAAIEAEAFERAADIVENADIEDLKFEIERDIPGDEAVHSLDMDEANKWLAALAAQIRKGREVASELTPKDQRARDEFEAKYGGLENAHVVAELPAPASSLVAAARKLHGDHPMDCAGCPDCSVLIDRNMLEMFSAEIQRLEALLNLDINRMFLKAVAERDAAVAELAELKQWPGAKLIRERDAVQAALREYGRHIHICQNEQQDTDRLVECNKAWEPDADCNCGFDAALNGASDAS